MPPNRTAQTSTEAKKAYKKNGPAISERTHKQLQRGYELEQRAAREREAEKRRKLAKEKREERERKENAIRQQLGVGLATQLIGYSHTQANLKKGMETFLGVNKKKQDEERRMKDNEKKKEEELAKKLEIIAQDIEKEPFDDDDEDMDHMMLHLPIANMRDGGGWVDDELDDDTLLEMHDLIMSDPVEEPASGPQSLPPRPATAPPTPQKPTSDKSQHSTQSPLAPNPTPTIPKMDVAKGDFEFTRTHGPVNRTVESALEKLSGDVIELLSQDVAAHSSQWAPAHGLLYKLNPFGVPPHRLRVKVGCVVVCLRDLNTSSQLSKSQHVRILRVENERLECLTLDGQLAGTKTVITRVPFPARYRNDDNFPFTRTQYPVRVATDYILTDPVRYAAQSGFKLPSMNGKMRPPALVKRQTPPACKSKIQTSSNPTFKLPGLPASKGKALASPEPSAPVQFSATTLDGWDEFLESSTQIARDLSADTIPKILVSNTITRPTHVIESVPPLSTQDLDFSLDDLDDESQDQPLQTTEPMAGRIPALKAVLPPSKSALAAKTMKYPPSVRPGPLSRTANIRRIDAESVSMPPPSFRPQKSLQLKSKRPMIPTPKVIPPAKKPCVSSLRLAPPPLPTATATASIQFSDFGMSTQEASSFFDDDDDFAFGSPPIAV